MSRPVFNNPLLESEFAEMGIVKVPLLNADEVSVLTQAYYDTKGNFEGRNFHSTMFADNADYRKKISEEISKVILPKVTSLLNAYKLLFANYIVKEVSPDTKVGIHQDWNFTSPEHISVNIWIPLTNINETNGMFYGLKGSHKTFKNIRYTPYADGMYNNLEAYIKQHSSAYTLMAGEALIYHGALVHYSDPNLSNQVRMAVGAALIPENSPNLHYYRPRPDDNILEIYKTSEQFYHGFNFFEAPKGVEKVGELREYALLPSPAELI